MPPKLARVGKQITEETGAAPVVWGVPDANGAGVAGGE